MYFPSVVLCVSIIAFVLFLLNVSEPFYFNFESLRFKKDTCMILIFSFSNTKVKLTKLLLNASNKYLLGFFSGRGDVTIHCILEVMCRTY